MFKKSVIVFNWKHMTREYYTFKKNGRWCACVGANVTLYLPKYLENNIAYLLYCAYSAGECDGQFETDELHAENGDFAHGRDSMA